MGRWRSRARPAASARSPSRSWRSSATKCTRSPESREETKYLKGIGAKEIVDRRALDLAKIRPLDKATWAGAVDNLGGDHARVAAVDVAHRRHRRRGRPCGRHEAQHDSRAVHPARRAPARRGQREYADAACARRSGTGLPSSGGRIRCTTRCARSTSTSCRRTSTRTSRAWSAAARSCGSEPDTHP